MDRPPRSPFGLLIWGKPVRSVLVVVAMSLLTLFADSAPAAAADFFLVVYPQIAVAGANGGSGARYSIYVLTRYDDLTENATLSVEGLPPGSTGTFDPASGPVELSSVLNVGITTATPNGSFDLTITATTASQAASSQAALVVHKQALVTLYSRPPHVITYGQLATVTGRISFDDFPLAGRPIFFFQDGVTSFSVGGGVDRTDERGELTVLAEPIRTTRFRAEFPGDTDYIGTSVEHVVKVRTRVRAAAEFSHQSLGTVNLIRTRVTPLHRQRYAQLQVRDGRRWRGIADLRLNSLSRASYSWRPRHTGNYILRVVMPGHPAHLAGSSRWIRVAVVRESR